MEEEKTHNHNVKVYTRIRPFSFQRDTNAFYTKEEAKLCKLYPRPIFKDSIKSVAVLQKSISSDKNLCKKKTFEFDNIFDGSITQQEIYANTVESEVHNSIQNGNNLIILSYGQTGAGKTFTSIGDTTSDSLQGILPRIFHTCCEVHKLEIKFSAFAIYLENITDLLNLENKKLSIKETKMEGLFIEGLSVEIVNSVATANEKILKSLANNQRRNIHMGSVSSRDFVIFQLELPNSAKITVLDLAGSERIQKTVATGTILKESSAIVKSLVSLARIFSALSGIKPAKHIPFRDSKLTRFLQSVLNRNSHLIMFLLVSPCWRFVDESYLTLRFGSVVKNINLNLLSS